MKHARQTTTSLRHDGSLVSADDASMYDRSRYGAGMHSAIQIKRKRIWPKIIGVICAILVVAIGIVLGYALWFGYQLDSALAPDGEMENEFNDVLAPASIGEPFYVLLLGSDSREGYTAQAADRGDSQRFGQRSDVIILARIDAMNKVVTLVSVPRDTPYELEDGTLVKINEMYNREGAVGSIKAVSEVTGVPISHFAEVGFTDLQAIVDLLGGVDVYVNTDLSYWNPVTNREVSIPAGQQTINGEQAQIFARARHEYQEFEGSQDSNRQNNVRQLLSAVLKKTLDRPVTEIPGVVLQEAEYVTTDMKSADLAQLAITFGLDSDDMTLYSGSGPSNGDFAEQADGLYLCYRNPEGWARLMNIVDAGGEPTGIDYESTQILW